MKPEPLTKEKIVEKVLTEYFEGDKKIAKTIIEEEVVDMHNFNIVNFIERTVDITKEEFRKRIDWLLKEIEKRENINFVMDELKVRWLDSEWWEGYCYALDWFKNLIKKAFSGVIEE